MWSVVPAIVGQVLLVKIWSPVWQYNCTTLNQNTPAYRCRGDAPFMQCHPGQLRPDTELLSKWQKKPGEGLAIILLIAFQNFWSISSKNRSFSFSLSAVYQKHWQWRHGLINTCWYEQQLAIMPKLVLIEAWQWRVLAEYYKFLGTDTSRFIMILPLFDWSLLLQKLFNTYHLEFCSNNWQTKVNLTKTPQCTSFSKEIP